MPPPLALSPTYKAIQATINDVTEYRRAEPVTQSGPLPPDGVTGSVLLATPTR